MAENCLPSSKSSEISSKTGSAAAIPTSRLAPRHLETLWARMVAIYGHAWITNYGSNPEGLGGDTWAAGLAGLTGAQLAEGLRACALAGEDWPPSLGKFRRFCFCIPDIEAVSVMLKPGAVEVSPFARLVYANLDAYELRRADARTARQIIRGAYALASKYVLAGGELPAQVERLGHDPRVEEMLYRQLHDKQLASFCNAETEVKT